MSTTQIDTIIQAVRAALSRRDERRDILAAKIRELAEVALDAARRRSIDLGEIGRLEYRRPQADCSQWSNRVDCPAHVGEPVLVLVGVEVRSLGPVPDIGFFDGNNMQHQQGRIGRMPRSRRCELWPPSGPRIRAQDGILGRDGGRARRHRAGGNIGG